MLYGIRTELQNELAERGYKVRVYVAYGTHCIRFSCAALPSARQTYSSFCVH